MNVVYFPQVEPVVQGTLVTTDEPDFMALVNPRGKFVSVQPNGSIEERDTIGEYEKCQPFGPILQYARSIAPGVPIRTFYLFCQSIEKPLPPPIPVPPDPLPADEPWMQCVPIADASFVGCVKSNLPAQPSTPEGAFEITKRVAWGMRGRGVGLLLKPGGDNIVTWHGQSYSAGRVCYSDGRIVKILTDVPTTNGPTWADNGTGGAYSPAIDPNT